MTGSEAWIGRPAADRQLSRFGEIEDLYSTREALEPDFAIVNIGVFAGLGTRLKLVPLAGASEQEAVVVLDVDESAVRDSTDFAAEDTQLSEEQEAELRRHYGLPEPAPVERKAGDGELAGEPGLEDPSSTTMMPAVDAPAPAPTPQRTEADLAEEGIVVSEEQLRVTKTQRVRERVRLEKRVVIEEVHLTVPVRREQLRIERIPVDADGEDQPEASTELELSEAQYEIVLFGEEPVVEKRVVPLERVQLHKEVVTQDERIDDQLRKERVDIERSGDF